MGRELRRREAKNKKNKKQTNNSNIELDTGINLITFLKLVFFIILLLFVIYYILAVFVTKEIDISNGNSNDTEEVSDTDTSSISDKILASNIFNQTDSVYYVYFYDFNAETDDNLSSLISSSVDEKVYKVDTGSGLNSKYVTDSNGNLEAKDIDDLKVTSNTLIKIDHDEIVEYFEGKNDIMSGIKD